MPGKLTRPLRIVAIGGGTGLSTLLSGLKHYTQPAPQPDLRAFEPPPGLTIEITAVVTVTDDGGSSGRLRRDFDVLPPGDIRNCMVSLSADEALLSRLFQYRFSQGRGLKGHSFGNLFLTALTQLTGDFAHAIKVSSEILASAGRIYPSTSANVTLEAQLEDGTVVSGESRISKSRSPIRQILLRPRRVRPLPETLQAIQDADLITFGPGSLFTSIIPNLLVGGMAQAIRRSKAAKAYFCNLMWQPGETIGFRASDHIRALHRHSGGALVDIAILNSSVIPRPQRQRYAAQRAKPVEMDAEQIEAMGIQVVSENLLAATEKVRHDPHRAAAVAVRLALASFRRQQRAALLHPLVATARG
ncbi:MAG: YvcK family protein [Bryobacteraceae bacterium]|nr:YvcK family protein [Bryobacteraceae bacterium]MDW8376793.1 YvcK family protein [Bryobacterales bacterium]